MEATNVVMSTDTAGIGYHHQGQPAHLRTITTIGDDHRAPGTPQVDMMTGEARADPPERQKYKSLKTPQHRQAHQQRQKHRTETHARLQPSPEPITPQTVAK